MKTYDVVIPIAEKDVNILLRNFSYFTAFLPMKRLVVIGNQKVEVGLQQLKSNIVEIKFINEDSILSFGTVKNELNLLSNGDGGAEKRTGWYLQQFLKMMYAFQCEDKYYLVWDADTIPLRRIEMEEKEKPIFHMKEECHTPYFYTLERLIPNLSKRTDKSFIAEHMLFNTAIMKNMIADMERHELYEGLKFWQVILNCMEKIDLSRAGFSEFETYGNYCLMKYPNEYVLQEWKAFRGGESFFDRNAFSEEDAKWVSQDYETITFENVAENKKVAEYKIYKNKLVQKIFKFSFLCGMFSDIKKKKATK